MHKNSVVLMIFDCVLSQNLAENEKNGRLSSFSNVCKKCKSPRFGNGNIAVLKFDGKSFKTKKIPKMIFALKIESEW